MRNEVQWDMGIQQTKITERETKKRTKDLKPINVVCSYCSFTIIDIYFNNNFIL